MKNPHPPYSILRILILIFIFSSAAKGQSTLTLDSCFAWARANYPLIHQFDLVEKSRSYNLNTASQGKRPQLFMAGTVTYQSEVTTVPIALPNQEVPIPPKNQAKLYGEVSQSLNDLFVDNKYTVAN